MDDPPPPHARREGFALVSVLFLALALLGLLWAMFSITNRELTSMKNDADMTRGFFAAEAGLNVRGEAIRREFEGYRRPSGGSPPGGSCPDDGSGGGFGDFACETLDMNGRTVTTYVEEDPSNNDPDSSERLVTIPAGETFAGLKAQEYRYSVVSEAVPPHDSRPEAVLEMVFRTRLVPMFQFAAFYDKDLEILPGADMTLDGRVHTNGDLYLNGDGAELAINGQVTASVRSDGSGGSIHRGRKDRVACGGEVRLPGVGEVACTGSSFDPLPEETFDASNGQVRVGLDELTVPEPETFDIGGLYWDEADVRIGLDLRNGEDQAEPVVLRSTVFGGDPDVDVGATDTLHACLAEDDTRVYGPGPATGLQDYDDAFGDDAVRAVEYSGTFRHHREDEVWQRMLEVDARGLLDCLHANADDFFAPGDTIDTDRNGGLVWYLTVLGPDADDDRSGYGVRIRNGARLAAPAPDAPEIEGLTIASDQAAFVQGDYNVDGDWRPASFLVDSMNVLSSAWDDDRDSQRAIQVHRVAEDTEINAAFLSGTDVTGGADGAGGQGGDYNGGLENYPRFHEYWTGATLSYKGSFVSLGEPDHAHGEWSYGNPVYTAPQRDWNYDARFDQAQNLPPLSPRFVYLVQERFIRDFER